MKFLLILTLAFTAMAQTYPRFSATTGDVSLSAAGTALTIQQPASGAKIVKLESALVYCSVACSVTQSQLGTAATATAGSITSMVPISAAPAATAWTASNAGSGTSVGGSIHVQAGTSAVIDLSKIVLPKGGTGINYTVTVGSITGTANITIVWSEQ